MAWRDWVWPKIEAKQDSGQEMSDPVMSSDLDTRSFAEQLAFHLNAKGITTENLDIQVYNRGYTRNRASAYIALNRCVQIISGACAELMCGGELSIIDRMGNKVEDQYTRAVLDVFTGSYDRGETSTRTLIEDVMADYGYDGNGLLEPIKIGGRLVGFKRYQSWDASRYQEYEGGPRVYYAQEAESEFGNYGELDATELIHVRFPLFARQGNTNSTRLGFATAPITDMRDALKIGIDGDKYIKEWFGRGAKSGIHINIMPVEGKPAPTPDQRVDIANEIKKAARSGDPIVTFNSESNNIVDTPQDREALGLREFQVQEMGRYFGIPLPLLSVSLGQWGTAVNEQVGRLAYRWGVKLHMDRLLSAMQIKLLMPGQRFLVDPTGLVRGDAEGMQKLITALQGSAQAAPVATREELRHLAGLPREPEGIFHAPMKPMEEGDGTGGGNGSVSGNGAMSPAAISGNGAVSLEEVLSAMETIKSDWGE